MTSSGFEPVTFRLVGGHVNNTRKKLNLKDKLVLVNFADLNVFGCSFLPTEP
jgi:hypothetical protein